MIFSCSSSGEASSFGGEHPADQLQFMGGDSHPNCFQNASTRYLVILYYNACSIISKYDALNVNYLGYNPDIFVKSCLIIIISKMRPRRRK